MWAARPDWLAKYWKHISHWNGLSPVWLLMCVTRSFFLLKHLVQMLHLWFLIPECTVFWCAANESLLWKYFPQVTHFWALPPMCTILCFFKCAFLRNSLAHILHLYVFSGLWVCWCWSRELLNENSAPHVSQQYDFSPVWLHTCLLSWNFNAKRLSHKWHLNSFSASVACVVKWFFKTCCN